MKIFLYDDWRLGYGHFASVDGFKLTQYKDHDNLEAIREEDGRIYGYIYEVDEMSLDMLDAYYGVDTLHRRITVTATLQGGQKIEVQMYESLHAEMV